jgi:tetratricopeptide (TPR) repeat protein
MNNPLMQRAVLLYQQRRFDLAGEAVREALGQEPTDGYGHALLGLCLMQQKKYDEAMEEVGQAIVHAPDMAFAHYAAGCVLQERNRFEEAEVAAREAVRLAPEDANYWGLLSQTFVSRKLWARGLEAADHGLEADPEDATCVNLRAVALVNLGRKEEAAAAIGETLARNPFSTMSHANQGWTLLHQNKPKEALEHFREALRLNPENEWAREGTMAALKARYLPYRLMLWYYLWMSRFGRQRQWMLVIGFWVAYQILNAVRASHPEMGPYIWPVLIAYVAFALASWLADPLFNLTLMVNPFGRYLLSVPQRIGALLVGGLLLVGVGLVTVAFVKQDDLAAALAILTGAVVISVATATRQREKQRLWLMAGYTAAVAIAGVGGVVMMGMGVEEAGGNLFLAAIWGGMLSGVASNVLAGMVVKK